MPHNVLIPTKLNTVAKEILEARGFTVVQDADTPIEELAKAYPETSALIVRSNVISPEIIDALPKLKVIVRAGSGYNTIDIKYARRRGIDVMNTPGANANAVAEEVIALILAGYRHIPEADRTTREGLWEKKKLMGRELTRKTVGIVGLGNIGQLLVKRLAGFECSVLAYDPVISANRAGDLGVDLVDIETLFSKSDIVSLHVPETDETRGMINGKLFALMPDGAMLVNCARAGVVNEDDLRAAKQEKTITFCNDVYPKDAAGEKSVADIADVMMPHLGASTVEANTNAARRAAEQLVDYAARGVSTYIVNSTVPEGLSESYQHLAYYLSRVCRAYLGSAQPQRLEVSFYGDLREFEPWLLASIVQGFSTGFDPLFDYREASQYLEEMGIEYVCRDVDTEKGYGNAITLDLMEGSGTHYDTVSARGTVAEGRCMISRVGAFDNLYLQPDGHICLVVYEDRPGMIARITTIMAQHDINIEDIRAPHDPRSGESMAALKLNKPVDKQILDELLQAGMKKAVGFSL